MYIIIIIIIIVWTHENTAPITGMGSTAFVVAVPYPVKVSQISCKGQWNSKKRCKKIK